MTSHKSKRSRHLPSFSEERHIAQVIVTQGYVDREEEIDRVLAGGDGTLKDGDAPVQLWRAVREESHLRTEWLRYRRHCCRACEQEQRNKRVAGE